MVGRRRRCGVGCTWRELSVVRHRRSMDAPERSETGGMMWDVSLCLFVSVGSCLEVTESAEGSVQVH